MASRGQFRYTTNEEGDLVLQQYGEGPTGERQWFTHPSLDAANGYNMMGRKVRGQLYRKALGEHNAAKQRALEAYQGGQAEVLRAEDANQMDLLESNMTWPPVEIKDGKLKNNMSWPPITGKWPIVAGRESDKLIAGAADLKDIALDVNAAWRPAPNNDPRLKNNGLLDTISEVVPEMIGLDSFGIYDRRKNREEDQQNKDELYEQFNKNAGPIDSLSAALPYYVSGMTLPPISRQVGRTIDTAINSVEQGAKKVGGIVGDVIRNRAKKPSEDILTRLAREVEDEVITPLQRRADYMGKRPPIRDEFRDGTLATIGGSAALGAVEGAVHYDENPIEGALSSIIGATAGKLYEPKLARAPIKPQQEARNRIVRWAEEKGYRPLPGMRTGQPGYQSKESGFRNDEKYSGMMAQFDDANDQVLTRVAGETMGIVPESTAGMSKRQRAKLSDQEMQQLTPEKLQAHMDKLSAEYEQLAENSVGKLNYQDLKKIQDDLANSPDTKLNRRARKELQAHIDYLNTLTLPGRDPKTGRLTSAQFDGRQYQAIRSKIKSDADAAWNSDNKELYRSLKSMLDLLDDGMYRGVQQKRGVVGAELWKDLNERYAMSQLVLNKGMNPIGGVNLNRLSEHLMANDASRTLLEQGGRVTDLQKLIKLHHIERTQKRSNMEGSGVTETPEKVTETGRLLHTPDVLNPGILRRTKMRAYQKGWPSVTGLLNLPREGVNTAPALMRAIEQGTDMHPRAAKAVWNLPENARDTAQSWYQSLMDYITPDELINNDPETEEEKKKRQAESLLGSLKQ